MGNICRSPTAEEVLRVKARQAGLRIEFDSAGTENYHIGDAPDPRSVSHARDRGYDLSALRARQVRNFLATLLLSQGVPMIAHGDELGRTQQGNNNVYAQDSELSWVDWARATE